MFVSRLGGLAGRLIRPLMLLACLGLAGLEAPAQTAAAGAAAADPAAGGGPVRLRQPGADLDRAPRAPSVEEPPVRARPARPGDFELFVRRLAGQASNDPDGVRRLGSELIAEWLPVAGQDGAARIPPDYVVAAGDELQLTLWGSVDAELRLVVDRAGQIAIPRVGSVLVAGTRFADLNALLTQRVGQVFRNFQLNVSLWRMRQIRVYVTGFVERPGSYSVGGLSTIVNAVIRAGGPSAAGSFRNIQLRRAGRVVSTYDLYDLLVKGDNSNDRTLQAEDVIHISAVGPQVGLIGSVNKPAVFELKPTESFEDLLRMSGGFTAVADRTRLAIERLDDRNDIRIVQVALPGGLASKPTSGDVIRVFSAVDAALPVERQNKRVRVEGEVLKPGEYVLPAGSSVEDALRAAGGLTVSAYIFGTEFNRESVRSTQQENYDRALRDLETELARAAATQRTSNAEEAAAATARGQGTNRLVDRLRTIRPTGRIVLQIDPVSPMLPNLALEDGDRLFIPARPTTVGVFGSVFNGGSYLYADQRRIDYYLRLAGGPTRGADPQSIFVIRANGSVVSDRQRKGGWLGGGDAALGELPALPGDTVFVPEEMDKTTFTQRLKDWTQILSQFGLGLAAIKTLSN
ncbi:MAG: SLBB domain-containing protein [Rubrivivax sp.]|nr:SLBB domain-containing protein [Rubrivivax sp.]